ncbi:MAG: hypothetical protein JSR76_08625 [Verrucomicrobia bacterium]|nr:hypothetical protein [Verrucomicrobiota bacterium]
MQMPRIQFPSQPIAPKEGGWTHRSSYQLGRTTIAPFDLSSMKKAPSAKRSRFSLIQGLIDLFFPEEELQLTSLEEYRELFPLPTKPSYAFAPIFPYHTSPSLSDNLIFAGVSEERIESPLSKELLSLMPYCKATLHKGAKGLYYIKFPDTLIRNLQMILRTEGGRLPSYFHLLEEEIGAHVPAILAEEAPKASLKEVGHEFYLSLQGLFKQTLPSSETIWYLSFHSPALEDLRQRYGLLRKVKGFDFTCLVATKLATKKKASPEYLINPASSPV